MERADGSLMLDASTTRCAIRRRRNCCCPTVAAPAGKGRESLVDLSAATSRARDLYLSKHAAHKFVKALVAFLTLIFVYRHCFLTNQSSFWEKSVP